MLSFFGFSQNNVQKNKKKKKKKYEDDQFVNPIKNVHMIGSTKMGTGPKKTESQDSYCIMKQFSDECYFLGVYDGHGHSGKDASHATNDFIQNFIEKNDKNKKIKMLQNDQQNEDFLREAFRNCEDNLKQSGIDYSNSGTCANAIFIHTNNIYIANIGDSRSVLYRVTNKENIALELSYDQATTRNDEKERILRYGGKIERMRHDDKAVGPYRVWLDDEGPGISTTRSLGDWMAKKIGIISEPEVQHIEIHPKFDQFIVCATDGLWQVMNSAEVCGFVKKHREEYGEKIAEKLIEEAKNRWDEINKQKEGTQNMIRDVPFMKYGVDDMTVVIAYLEYIDNLDY